MKPGLFSRSSSQSRFAEVREEGQSEGALAGAAGDISGRATPFDSSHFVAYKRKFFQLPPEVELADLLEKAEFHTGDKRRFYFAKIILLLSGNRHLIDIAPKKFHSNPLELAIKIADAAIISELLTLKATVRSENSELLSRIKHLLPGSTKPHLYIASRTP